MHCGIARVQFQSPVRQLDGDGCPTTGISGRLIEPAQLHRIDDPFKGGTDLREVGGRGQQGL